MRTFRSALAVLLLLALGAAGGRYLFTRAETMDFHPLTCLGTWQNPQLAQGAPESLTGEEIGPSNSARLEGDGQIFCGGFVPPEFEAEGEFKGAALTLFWKLEGENVFVPAPIIVTSTATGTEPLLEAGESAPAPDGTTTPLSASPLLSFGIARAQEPPGDQPVPEEAESEPDPSRDAEPAPAPASTADHDLAPPPAASSAEPGVIVGPDIGLELAPLASSTPSSTLPSGDSPEPPPPPLTENFLILRYSLDGQNWYELQKAGPFNWSNLTVPLPVQSWNDLKKLQVSLEVVPSVLESLPETFLDGMLIEAQYDLPPAFLAPLHDGAEEGPEITVPDDLPIIPLDLRPSHKKTFGGQEVPSFDLELDSLPALPAPRNATSASPAQPLVEPPVPEEISSSSTSSTSQENPGLFGRVLKYLRFSAQAQTPRRSLTASNPVAVQVKGPRGEFTPFQVTVLTTPDKMRVQLPDPGRQVSPGKYRIRMWILRGGVVYETESEFYWGVLAVNFNKSIYPEGDTAKIGVGVLDDQGHTICDAQVELRISEPSGKQSLLTTRNGKVEHSSECGPVTVTDKPDYFASVSDLEVGVYQIQVTAYRNDVFRTITDSFRVENPPAFDVERTGPTRIFPVSKYRMSIRIKANRDFKGVAVERVPASFEIFPSEGGTVTRSRDELQVAWPVDIREGDTAELFYVFDAPDISPELYRLGSLQLSDWQEARQWQIAADAVGDIILLWDGANIPNGWTCLSCSSGDPFFGVFPRGSSTYASASSSADTGGHSANFVSHTAGTSQGISNTGSTRSAAVHTHPVSGITVIQSDIRPPFRNLKFIRANTSTLPNGTIGMFAGSSSSLPSGWAYYSAMANSYLRGDNSTSTGGASEHSHFLTADVDAASETAGGNQGGGTQVSVANSAHIHVIDGSTPNASNTPPFANVVFGKLTATGTLPTGLIAMFDASPPSGWAATSTMHGRLIRGSDAYGGTGGASTHSHATTTITSGAPSDPATTRTGANNVASGGHNHNFTFNGISSETSFPAYRDVIFAVKEENQSPSVANVTVNGGSAITLTPNTTTSVPISFQVTDGNGCSDVFNNGSVDVRLYRSGAGPSCSASTLNCYVAPVLVHDCISGNTANATATFGIYYFAQATDASSSFSAENWLALVEVQDASAATSSATSTGVELNTLLAIDAAPLFKAGPLSPSDASSTLGDWLSPLNASTSDDQYASVPLNQDEALSSYLSIATLGFNLPLGARIKGIVSAMEHHQSDQVGDGNIEDSEIKIVKNGAAGSANKARVGFWPGADDVAEYGGVLDTWGESWTAADINASNFGLYTQVILRGGASFGATAKVDHISMTVYYQTTSTVLTYGTLSPNSDTSNTNQLALVQNAGNSSSTLSLSGTALTSGSASIPTSSQKYATSSFDYSSGGTALSGTSAQVSGFLLSAATSSVGSSRPIYWGIGIPAGVPALTYSGSVTYVAGFSP